MERFDGLYNLPTEEGQPIEVVQTRRLRAISDHVSVWRQEAYVKERGLSGLPEVTLFGPGEIAIIDTHVDSATGMRIFITEVRFPEPIRYGQSIEFTLTRRVQAKLDHVIQSKGWDWYGLVTLKSPMEYASIGLRLPPGRLPRAIWRYEDIAKNGYVTSQYAQAIAAALSSQSVLA